MVSRAARTRKHIVVTDLFIGISPFTDISIERT